MNIAVLGLGFMGSTHLKALMRMPGARVVAVASNDETQLSGDLSGVQGNIGGPGEMMDFSAMARYRDALEAVRDPQVEAVDICLPTAQHAEAAIAALRAGKHVLVEKPMALEGAEAGRMIAEAERIGRVLMVAQVVRFMPSYRVAADMLRGGKLGSVRSAIFRRRCAAPAWSQWLSDPAQSGGGVFDLLVHDIDFAVHLFGIPESVSARGYVDMARGIDWIAADFRYPAIGAVMITGGWHHPKAFPFSMEYTVVADGGTLEYSSAGVPLTLYGADGKGTPLPTPEVDGYQSEIEYFVACASQGRAPALCPPRESAAAVKLARLMTESRNRKGEQIPCRF
jgi:predicted dehydrogenase